MTLIDYKCEKHLATITMRRGEKRNALNEEMLTCLNEAWTRFMSDDDAWVAIITGEGDIFCAGADRSFVERSLDEPDIWNRFNTLTSIDPYLSRRVGKPTISAINGSCFGGGVSLALSADFRIADEEAVFRMPETDFGALIIDWHTGVPLPVLAALNIGLPVTAKRAYEVGLLNEIVHKDRVMDEAAAFAESLLSKPPLSLRKNLEVTRMLYAKTDPMEHIALHDYCTQLGVRLSKTEDSKEAMNAYLNKKPPNYQGK